MLRRLSVVACSALLLASLRCATADDHAATAPPEPPVQQTEVHGTPPDLTGRWLAVAWLDLPGGRTSTLTALWEIGTSDGKPVLTHQFVDLPPDLKAAIDKANHENWRWTPSATDLETVAADWESLPATTPNVAQVQSQLAGHDGFEDAFKEDEHTKDADFLITQRFDMSAAGAPVIRQVFIYAPMTHDADGYGGNFDNATVAAAPFPIPIHLTGSCWIYPVVTTHKGVASRVLDFFSGCGRR